MITNRSFHTLKEERNVTSSNFQFDNFQFDRRGKVRRQIKRLITL